MIDVLVSILKVSGIDVLCNIHCSILTNETGSPSSAFCSSLSAGTWSSFDALLLFSLASDDDEDEDDEDDDLTGFGVDLRIGDARGAMNGEAP